MLVIGIAGGSGSGKTTVVKAITEQLHDKRVVVIPQDAYYKDSSDLSDEEKRNHNFDHPDAIDWELLCKQLSELKKGNRCIPTSPAPGPRPRRCAWSRPTSSSSKAS